MKPLAGLVNPKTVERPKNLPIMSGNIKMPTNFPDFKPTIQPVGGLVGPQERKPIKLQDAIKIVLKDKKAKIGAGIAAALALTTIILKKIIKK